MENFRLPAVLKTDGNRAHNWKIFKQQYEIYMKASDLIKKDKDTQAAILLNLVGEDGLELYNSFKLSVADAKDVTKVLEAFEQNCTPKVNDVYERYKFNRRVQKDGESFDSFLADIKTLVKTCAYGTQEESILRDRIVLGITDVKLQEKLFGIEKLDLDKAIEACRAAEITKAHAKEVQGHGVGETTTVDAIKRNVTNNYKNFHNSQSSNNHFRQNTNNSFKDDEKRKNFDGEKTANSYKINCFRCGRSHEINKCPAFGQTCRGCGGRNHFAKQCRKDNKTRIDQVSRISEDYDDILFVGSLNVLKVSSFEASEDDDGDWFEDIIIEKTPVSMKVDTGARANVLPWVVVRKLMKKLNLPCKLKETKIVLEAFGGFKVIPLGTVKFDVEFNNKKVSLVFFVVDGPVKHTPILGLKAIELLGIVCRSNKINILGMGVDNASNFIRKHKSVFEGLGKFEDKCSFHLKEDARFSIKPARRIPFALHERFKAKLDRLVQLKVIEKVNEPLDMIHNLVITEKPDKTLRLCLDPQELNKNLKPELYMIPTGEEIKAKLTGKRIFSVLDCKDGFYQIELDEKSSKLCAFNTMFGCYKFLRLPFGVSTAPQLFQKLNSKNFGDIEGVIIFIDDILIAAETEEEHDRIMEQVMERAKLLNVKFKESKLQYKLKEVRYLGHIYSEEGVRVDPDRIKAIHNIKNPKNKKELQSVLGMINFLREYLPNLSEKTAPLRELLRQEVVWNWTPSHTKCLEELKETVSESPVLGIFDESKEITVQTDASQSGMGGCLMQEGRPIAYASRSLTDCEKRYGQIEKELLAIVFACRKFHFYIYGKSVRLQTDHKPLIPIFKKDICNIPSARLQRMRLKLIKYNLNLVHVPGKRMYIADLLSRSFDTRVSDFQDETDLNEVVHSINMSKSNEDRFKLETERDEVLKNLKKQHLDGWPEDKQKFPDNIKIYYKWRNEIFLENDLLFHGDRLFVPKSLRKEMLNLIHEGHQGVLKCKLRARSLLFWPGMTNDIEDIVMSCKICEKFRDSNRKESLMPHEVPSRPFQYVSTDLLEYGNQDYLVVIDKYSKWLDIVKTSSKRSGELIEILKSLFATHGIPERLYADNVPFSSREFKDFARSWNFEIITSSPIYPQSNGQAEKAVNVAKNFLRKCQEAGKDLTSALLQYRNTEIPSLRSTPAQMLMSRMCRTKIPTKASLLCPGVVEGIKEKLENNNYIASSYYNKRAHRKVEFKPGDNVVYRKGKTWQSGRILSKANEPRSFNVLNENKSIIRRNSIHLKKSRRELQFDNSDDYEYLDSHLGKFTNPPRRVCSNPNDNNTQTITRYGRVVQKPQRYGY